MTEDQPVPPRTRTADPGHPDAVVRDNTGRNWDDWCELIEARPDAVDGHTAVASWLQSEHGLDGWWAQAVTVGWERLTGRRLRHQMADGTFTATRSATIAADADALRAKLLDASGRARLFPGEATTLRSRPTSKHVRIALGGGVAELAVAPRGEGRVTVTVSHAKLSTPDDVAYWQAYWADWLQALDER
ncbi:DUF4287 domain-containing protein [Egicoccus sp. AB-alg6-2]|uniref:DUF4287 domain-containing protein n=1 Tax=Egicoccus sp. AB-alg6-2 TaxID=3242692 RepID=UPI00359D7BED